MLVVKRNLCYEISIKYCTSTRIETYCFHSTTGQCRQGGDSLVNEVDLFGDGHMEWLESDFDGHNKAMWRKLDDEQI